MSIFLAIFFCKILTLDSREAQQAAYNYEVRAATKLTGGYPLRRTASEESVTVARAGNKLEIIAVNNNNRRKRPGHRKGKAPVPPREIVRSNSVNQVMMMMMMIIIRSQ